MRINVLVADGRKLLREGLCLLLEKHADFRVIGEADDGKHAVKLVRALPAHVVVLNLTAPDTGGTELVRAIRRASPGVRVIVLALSPSATWVRGMLKAGAAGCLTKEAAGAELVAAIRAVHDGRIYLCPSLVDLVVTGYVKPEHESAPSPKPLAPREREILRRIADGHSTKEIAAELKVGGKTIETHRRRIMQKLGAYTVAELTKHAIREGLTSLEPQA